MRVYERERGIDVEVILKGLGTKSHLDFENRLQAWNGKENMGTARI